MPKGHRLSSKVAPKASRDIKPLLFFTLCTLSCGTPRNWEWIAMDIERRIGFSVRRGQVLTFLHDLEDLEFVRARVKTNTDHSFEREFEITKPGLKYYQERTSKFRAKATMGD